MEKEYLLINSYNCRQIGMFSDLEDARAKAFELYRRSRIKERYLVWHIVEFDVVSGVRHKVKDYYYKIECFDWPRNPLAC